MRKRGKTSPGSVFILLHYREPTGNVFTIGKRDPDPIPEFKFCAVKLQPAGL